MDAQRLLQRMCQRHGLSASGALELKPLVERALVSPDRVRRRILEIIDDNLARRAGGDTTATLETLEADLDDEVLVAVAKKLHGWSPGKGLKTFGSDDQTDGATDFLPGGLGGDLGEAGDGPGRYGSGLGGERPED